MTDSRGSNLLTIGFASDGTEDPIQLPPFRDARDVASFDNDIVFLIKNVNRLHDIEFRKCKHWYLSVGF